MTKYGMVASGAYSAFKGVCEARKNYKRRRQEDEDRYRRREDNQGSNRGEGEPPPPSQNTSRNTRDIGNLVSAMSTPAIKIFFGIGMGVRGGIPGLAIAVGATAVGYYAEGSCVCP
jgi:hypothetical protein